MLDEDVVAPRQAIVGPLSLGTLILLVLLIGFLTSMISLGVWSAGGLSLEEMQGSGELNMSDRLIMRVGLIINHIGMFLLPAIAYAWYYFRAESKTFLKLDQAGSGSSYFIWGIIILVSYPFLAGLTQFNTSLPLPEWMTNSQDDSFAILGNALTMESPLELLMNIMLVGVAAAVGEELIFRGIVQQQLQRLWDNPHLGVIAAAAIFGGIHMQAERFLPLMFLGLVLGYSFYYTRSLWVPIVLHFINNTVQVGILYITNQEGIPTIDEVPDLPIAAVIISFVLTLGLAYKASLMSNIADESRP